MRVNNHPTLIFAVKTDFYEAAKSTPNMYVGEVMFSHSFSIRGLSSQAVIIREVR